jgi:hypothetical protein
MAGKSVRPGRPGKTSTKVAKPDMTKGYVLTPQKPAQKPGTTQTEGPKK